MADSLAVSAGPLSTESFRALERLQNSWMLLSGSIGSLRAHSIGSNKGRSGRFRQER